MFLYFVQYTLDIFVFQAGEESVDTAFLLGEGGVDGEYTWGKSGFSERGNEIG